MIRLASVLATLVLAASAVPALAADPSVDPRPSIEPAPSMSIDPNPFPVSFPPSIDGDAKTMHQDWSTPIVTPRPHATLPPTDTESTRAEPDAGTTLFYIGLLAAFLLALCGMAGFVRLIWGPDRDLVAPWYPEDHA